MGPVKQRASPKGGRERVQTTKFTPCGSRVCVIRITSYENRNPQGVIQNPNFPKDVPFENLTQLLFTMDALFDDLGSPQRAMEPRGFARGTPDPGPAAESAEDRKALATFRVDVIFRQNASWQGSLVWMDREEESQFRSALELIMLIDSAFRAESEKTA